MTGTTREEIRREFIAEIKEHPPDKETVEAFHALGMGPHQVAMAFSAGCDSIDFPASRVLCQMLADGEFDELFAGILGYC